MSKNKVMRVILGLMTEKEDLTGRWEKLYNEELHDMDANKIGDQIREDEKAEACTIHRRDKCT
jgi:hypothetical protein